MSILDIFRNERNRPSRQSHGWAGLAGVKRALARGSEAYRKAAGAVETVVGKIVEENTEKGDGNG
jgi:hypothetical protein